MKSSFQAFAEWLKKNNRRLYQKLTAVCRVDYLWKDFERVLADVDKDFFVNLGDYWLPDSWTDNNSCAEIFTLRIVSEKRTRTFRKISISGSGSE